VFVPKYSDVCAFAPFSLCADGVRPSRDVISWMTALRDDRVDAGIAEASKWSGGKNAERVTQIAQRGEETRRLTVTHFVQKTQIRDNILQF